MKNGSLTGVVEDINGNGVTLGLDNTREYIELADEIISGLDIGNKVRAVYKNQRIVRIFNISTQILYEVDINLTKPGHMKKLSLIFLATSVICAIPIAGALIGLVLIASIIGVSIKYGKNVLVKVIGISFASAIAYVAISTALMVNGHFLLSFIACLALVYATLSCVSKIQDSEAFALSKVAVAHDECLNFKAVNI
jgi:hypothetical protein